MWLLLFCMAGIAAHSFHQAVLAHREWIEHMEEEDRRFEELLRSTKRQ